MEDKTPPKPPPLAQKRNRQDDEILTSEDVEVVKDDGNFVAKKPRDSDSDANDVMAEARDVIDGVVEDETLQSNDFDDDYDDEEDDDYDDLVFFSLDLTRFRFRSITIFIEKYAHPSLKAYQGITIFPILKSKTCLNYGALHHDCASYTTKNCNFSTIIIPWHKQPSL